jgi:hypothetical protein
VQPPFRPLAFCVDDVAQAQRHRLADSALEVDRYPQAALEAGAGDLEGVVAGHRVVVVELAPDQARGQGDRLEVEAAVGAFLAVERDPQRAAAELEVVQVEVQVGDDRSDQALDPLQRAAVTHVISSPGCRWAGFSKEGVGRMSPRLRFIELQRPIEYIGWRVVFRRRWPASACPSSTDRNSCQQPK